MNDNKNKINTSTITIFWVTLAFSILTILSIFIMNKFEILISNYFFFSLAIILTCLDITLIVFAKKAKITKISRAFFILTGSSAAGIVIGIILHNLIYALFIKIFGEGF